MDNADNQLKRARLYSIGQMLENVDGFIEIASDLQHMVKMDILGRFAQSTPYGGDLERFVQKYTQWVKSHNMALSDKPAFMWETWAISLKDLYLSF